eukprot:scaffold135587_cov32-Tisochrysis_lutea.AAC.1
MAASSPPVPARISSMTFLSSFGSDGSKSTFILSSSSSICCSTSFISALAISLISVSSSLNSSLASASRVWHASYESSASTTASSRARSRVTRSISSTFCWTLGSSSLAVNSSWTFLISRRRSRTKASAMRGGGERRGGPPAHTHASAMVKSRERQRKRGETILVSASGARLPFAPRCGREKRGGGGWGEGKAGRGERIQEKGEKEMNKAGWRGGRGGG